MKANRRVLGLDVGIASIGWAILEYAAGPPQTVAAGVYLFNRPESDSGPGRGKVSKKAERGAIRRTRRQIRRRSERMARARQFLRSFGVLPDSNLNALHSAAQRAVAARQAAGFPVRALPWTLRAEGLDRALSADEWALVLGHLVGHRAYHSNAKQATNRNAADAADERHKMLHALQENDAAFTGAAQRGEAITAGQWLSGCEHQRNRSGDFRHSLKREWIVSEAKQLFARQRARGNLLAGGELEQAVVHLIEHQEQIRTPPVGTCTFESGQPRAAKHSYSFELFRFLQRLNNLRIFSEETGEIRRLAQPEIQRAIDSFGNRQSITYEHLRKFLDLTPSEKFSDVPDPQAEKEDVVARKGKGMLGTYALRKVVVDACGLICWQQLLENRGSLDAIAAAIAHNDDLQIIREKLASLSLQGELVDALVEAADGGKLAFFKGTGHLCVDALRKLEPLLVSGIGYYDALCVIAQRDARYEPSRDRASRRPAILGTGPAAVRKWLGTQQLEELIPSQVASRAVRETLKQVLALISAYGVPDAIHLEMSREVGKGAEARAKDEKEMAIRQARRAGLRESFQEMFSEPPTESEFERWLLWHQQKGKSAFSWKDMHPTWVADGENKLQVEHILPRSRFRNNSMDNKVLCLTGENQNKGSRTPHEWLKDEGGPVTWRQFEQGAMKMFEGAEFRRKLANLLLVDPTRMEASFKNRDLNDTRWIAKFLLGTLSKLSTDESRVHVQPVNAGLVGELRYGWGLDAWKRDPNDRTRRRADDRHHALDAAIVATVDQALVHRLTEAFKDSERSGRSFRIAGFQPPWRNFRRDLIQAVYGSTANELGPDRFEPEPGQGIFIVRKESRRERGEVHKATYYSVREDSNGQEVAFESIRIHDFDRGDLARVKDGERQTRLVSKLKEWIDKGRPSGELPSLPYRDAAGQLVDQPIRRIKVKALRHKPAVRIETGDDRRTETPVASADRSRIVRVDTFRTKDSFFFVPVYGHELAFAIAPNRAVVGGTEQPLPSNAKFLFSIYKNSYLEIVTETGKIRGYYQSFDRGDTVRLELRPHFTLAREHRLRANIASIVGIRKLGMDRLGLVTTKAGELVTAIEKRTWHGVVCT